MTRLLLVAVRQVRMSQAHGAIEPVNRDEREAVGLDKFGHGFHIHPRGEQLGAFGRIDAIEAGMLGRR